MAALFGGVTYEGVTLSRSEHRDLMRLYGVHGVSDSEIAAAREAHGAAAQAPEARRKPGDAAESRVPFDEVAYRRLMDAGATRNLYRHVTCDGLRVMAVLGRYLEPHADPVCWLIDALIDLGCDVDPEDVSWVRDRRDADDATEAPREG